MLRMIITITIMRPKTSDYYTVCNITEEQT